MGQRQLPADDGPTRPMLTSAAILLVTTFITAVSGNFELGAPAEKITGYFSTHAAQGWLELGMTVVAMFGLYVFTVTLAYRLRLLSSQKQRLATPLVRLLWAAMFAIYLIEVIRAGLTAAALVDSGQGNVARAVFDNRLLHDTTIWLVLAAAVYVIAVMVLHATRKGLNPVVRGAYAVLGLFLLLTAPVTGVLAFGCWAMFTAVAIYRATLHAEYPYPEVTSP
jgi:hypothetical protein